MSSQTSSRSNSSASMVSSAGLDLAFLDFLVHEHQHRVLPRLELFWDFYRNDLLEASEDTVAGRAFRLAQERGLPHRLTHPPVVVGSSSKHREIVIENDIAWRIHALVDFMFSKPIALQSLAPDRKRADLIERFLRQVFEASGGLGFMQDMALLGAIYGHVDVLLRTDDVRATVRQPLRELNHTTTTSHRGFASVPATGTSGQDISTPSNSSRGEAASTNSSDATAQLESERDAQQRDQIIDRAREFVLEIIEAPRAVPVLDTNDYRKLDAFVVHYHRVLNRLDHETILDRLRLRLTGGASNGRRKSIECSQVWTDSQVTDYEGGGEDRKRTDQRINRLGRIPVVHVQNLPQPFFYEGLSEVEPLIPLQNELNTRLSDRANRVTFQCFKMYLGKGIDGFIDRPIGPGQMWSTDNPDASIESFGGDGACPSEEAHITEVREALDKASTVTPLAAGVIRDRVGNLTSENALRVTMIGMLSRTEKKRVTYGQGIERLCELILHAADVLGVLPNEPHERRVRIDWPSPLPENSQQRLSEAKAKLELGVPRAQVLAELGYAECPAS